MIGFLAIDKPSGWTSHDIVAKVRKLTGVKKVGHAGTLDPMATGLVVLGLGTATRLLRFVQELPKVYVARVKFGVATDSLDADGDVVTDEPMPISRADLEGVIPDHVGEVLQTPPMVSALKVDGQRLHRLARQGVEIERQPRPVTIYSIELLSFEPGDRPEAMLRVRCGKGTYVRVLGDDLARALGGRAHLTGLRREAIGSLQVEDHAVTVEQIERAGDAWSELLIGPSDGLSDLPAVFCDPDVSRLVGNGRRFEIAQLELAGAAEGTTFRMIDRTSSELIAVYRVAGDMAIAEVVLA